MSGEPTDDRMVVAAAANLPLAERAAHANWKVRAALYDEVKANCGRILDSSDPWLAECAEIFPKACSDGNAAALDKALEAVLAFLGVASDQLVSRIARSSAASIVAKCLGARPSTQAKGIDALLAFVEAEAGDKVVPEMIEGFGNKVPKVVVGSLDATLAAVRAFGGRALPAQAILKALPPLFDSKDAKARERVKEITAELARWMGPDLIRATLFEKMRDAMKGDVEKLLQDAPPGRPKPERLTRKEAAKQAAAPAAECSPAPAGAAAAGAPAKRPAVAAAEEPEDEEPDSYEFAEPRDITTELKKDFWDALTSPKWSERKGALTRLRELASYPRLGGSEYFDLHQALRQIILRDSHQQVVSEALICTGKLAQGLRGAYSSTARSLAPMVIEKFKDKAAMVSRAALEALGVMHQYCFTVHDIAEDVTAALGHQHPKVKETTLLWLQECLQREPKPAITKLMRDVIPAVAKRTDEGQPAIREAALGVLVVCGMKMGSIMALDKATDKMEDKQKKKLEEMITAAARGGGAGGRSGPVSGAASAGSSAAASRAPSRQPSSSDLGAPARPAGRPAPRAAAPAASKAAAPRTSAPAAAAAAPVEEDENALSCGSLSKADAQEQLASVFGEDITAQLQDAAWKVRLEAMEAVVAQAQAPDAADMCSMLVQSMQHVPGWDDKNFQVLGRAMEVIRLLAANPDAAFSKREALVAVNGGLEKLADLKLKGPAAEMLYSVSEAVGPGFVAGLLHKKAVEHKNPKVLCETLNWITGAVEDFGLTCFKVPNLLAWAKSDLESPQAGTRTAAIRLLGAMHAFVGAPLGDMVRPDVKPALMSTIEAEFDKCPQMPPGTFEARRVSRAVVKAGRPAAGAKPGRGGSGAAPSAAAAAVAEAAALDDLLPRADISGQISGALLANLGSANWKERKASLDEVEDMIAAAGGRITPGLSDLVGGLKGRLSDTNKNLVIQTLALMGKLARAMGRPINREARPLLGPALKCLQDPKPTVRTAVIDMLDAWAAAAPSDHLFDEMADAIANPKVVGEGKQQGLAWMAVTIEAGFAGHDALPHIARAAALGAGYKTLPVREAAGAVLAAAAAQLGAGEVASAASRLDKASNQVLMDALSKATGTSTHEIAAAAAGGGSRPGTAASRPSTAASTSGRAGGMAGARSAVATGGLSKASSTKSLGSTSGHAGAAAATPGRPAAGAYGGAAAAAVSGNDGALLLMDTKKEERTKKARFKGTKFEMRADEVAALEVELCALASPALAAQLFGKDFKFHCRAAEMLREGLPNYMEEVLASLDLLLKWAVLRLSEGNTAVLLAVVAMLKTLFDMLIAGGHRLSEAEAKNFLPGLVEKSGQPAAQLRADCRDLMRAACELYPTPRVLAFVREGLDSKNNRTRVACAEEIGCMIDREGPRVYASSSKSEGVLPVVARLVSDRDKDIRAACLGTLEVVYCFEGDTTWALLGRLTDQQRSIVEERLKNVDKSLARQGLRAGYRTAAAGSGAGSGGGAAGEGSVEAGGMADLRASRHGLASAGGVRASRASGDDARSVSASQSAWSAAHGAAPVAPAAASAFLLAAQPSLAGSRPASAAAPRAPEPSPHLTKSGSGSGELTREWGKNFNALCYGPPDESVDVMKLLCYDMMDWSKPGRSSAGDGSGVAALVSANADALVEALARRTDEVFGTTSASGAPPNSRAAKYCLNTLMSVFSATQPPLAAMVGRTTLKALTTTLLLRLVDEQLGAQPEGEALLKALNVLMLKILENSERTSSFIVLLGLLLEAPPAVAAYPEREARWRDLVVKCLIKITKSLPATINFVDVSALLTALHNFFETLGVDEIRRRGAREDKPLRMVKTILHELCKLKGSGIYAHTGGIPQGASDSKALIFPYIDLNLQTLQGGGAVGSRPVTAPVAGTTAGAAPTTPGAPGARPASTAVTPGHIPAYNSARTPGAGLSDAPRLAAARPGAGGLVPPVVSGAATPGAGLKLRDDPIKAAMSDIFHKIGQKEHVEQAITDLYVLLQQRPDVDVNSYMAEASENFRSFIHRSLAKVRDKMAAQQQMAQARTPGPASQAPQSETRASLDAPLAPLDPQPRLSASKSGIGSNGGGGGVGTPSSGGSAGSGGLAAMRRSTSAAGGAGGVRAGAANMDQLRDRLKQIQGDISQLQAAPRQERNNRLEDLQARMRRLHTSDTSG